MAVYLGLFCEDREERQRLAQAHQDMKVALAIPEYPGIAYRLTTDPTEDLVEVME